MLLVKKLSLQDQLSFTDRVWKTAGDYSVYLPQGTYEYKVHGAGGSGGDDGGTVTYSGGSGGAGGVGALATGSFVVTKPSYVFLHVGEKGLTKANGGNGGDGGYSAENNGGGAGGGGGKPSYIKVGTEVIFALGGAGGGGGGGGAISGRYREAGGGGGGGGWYRFDVNTLTVISVPGASGGASGGDNDGEGKIGGAGNTVWFPMCYSGHGGGGGDSDGGRTKGGAGNNGGGAGGGGGGAGSGNHSSAHSGAGGGGAGGDYDAGGGKYGEGSKITDYITDAFIAHTIPTSTTDNEGNVQTSGWGVGGTPNTNGSDGWIYLKRRS